MRTTTTTTPAILYLLYTFLFCFLFSAVNQLESFVPTSNANGTSQVTPLSFQAPSKSNLKRRLTDCMENEPRNNTDEPVKKKRNIQFDAVTVYYFSRAQGFTCVPSQVSILSADSILIIIFAILHDTQCAFTVQHDRSISYWKCEYAFLNSLTILFYKKNSPRPPSRIIIFAIVCIYTRHKIYCLAGCRKFSHYKILPLFHNFMTMFAIYMTQRSIAPCELAIAQV